MVGAVLRVNKSSSTKQNKPNRIESSSNEMSERHTYTSAVGDCTITGAIITTDSFFSSFVFLSAGVQGEKGATTAAGRRSGHHFDQHLHCIALHRISRRRRKSKRPAGVFCLVLMKSFASYTNYLLYPGVFLRFKTKVRQEEDFFFGLCGWMQMG